MLLCVSSASAAPPVVVEGSSDCPTPDQVRQELASFTRRPAQAQPPFRVVVTRLRPSVASLRLFEPDGALALERSIESTDCESLAAAFAIIVKTHFLELGLELESPAQGTTDETQPPATTAAVREEEPALRKKRPGVAAADVPPSRPASPRAPAGLQVAVGVGAGARVDLPDPLAAAVARLELQGKSGPFVVRLEAAADLGAASSGSRPVRRQSSDFLVSSAVRWGEWPWLELRLGAGATYARVRAVELAGADTASTVAPAGLFAARGGFGTSSGWGGWLDVGALLLLKRDRYVIDPTGAVGFGPRWQGRAALGAQIPWW